MAVKGLPPAVDLSGDNLFSSSPSVAFLCIEGVGEVGGPCVLDRLMNSLRGDVFGWIVRGEIRSSVFDFKGADSHRTDSDMFISHSVKSDVFPVFWYASSEYIFFY